MDRGLVQKIGATVILVGAILMAWGLYGLLAVPVMCPLNGCSPDALRAIYYPYVVAFSIGAALTISGGLTIGLSFLLPKLPAAVEALAPLS